MEGMFGGGIGMLLLLFSFNALFIISNTSDATIVHDSVCSDLIMRRINITFTFSFLKYEAPHIIVNYIFLNFH